MEVGVEVFIKVTEAYVGGGGRASGQGILFGLLMSIFVTSLVRSSCLFLIMNSSCFTSLCTFKRSLITFPSSTLKVSNSLKPL